MTFTTSRALLSSAVIHCNDCWAATLTASTDNGHNVSIREESVTPVSLRTVDQRRFVANALQVAGPDVFRLILVESGDFDFTIPN